MVDEDFFYELVGKLFIEEFYGIVVKKGNKELVDVLNDVFKKIKDSGKYDEIYDKWIK